MGDPTQIIFLERILPHYRVPFFNALATRLAARDIGLTVFYGQEQPGSVPQTVQVKAEWAKPLHNYYANIGDNELIWQWCLRDLLKADLVVLEQANSLLLSHIMLARRCFQFRPVLAYWGHGRNLQSVAGNSPSERLKRYWAPKVDWWFAYTDLTRQYLTDLGFPPQYITVVENAIDTTALEKRKAVTTPDELMQLRNELKLTSDQVAIYCGGMYAGKRIDFLIEACHLLRAKLPNFHVIFIGDGPEQGLVINAATTSPWIHYVGPKFGTDRVPYFLLAKLLLMPGPVGLAILDSFVFGTPLATTNIAHHGPEIAYLQNQANGVMTTNSLQEYVAQVANLLQSPERLQTMRENCFHAASRYSIEGMADNFAAGLTQVLNQHHLRLS